jgi:hypothetical protein
VLGLAAVAPHYVLIQSYELLDVVQEVVDQRRDARDAEAVP